MVEEALDLYEIGFKLNKVDRQILKLLAKNCRISYIEIAREVYLSRVFVM